MSMILDAKQMTELLPMRQAIRLMREAFAILSSGDAVCPVRLNLPIEEQDANSLVMPCRLLGSGCFGIKLINVFPKNQERGMRAISAQYHLYSDETGVLLATMDGSLLTKIRTGAASGLATELFAKPEATVLAVFGTGVQAESQIEAACCVRDIREVMVFGLTAEIAGGFVERMAGACDDVAFRVGNDTSELREADVICTATNATEALFRVEDVKPGAHINAIGAYRPDMCELPAELIAECRLIIDQTEAALEEAGDIIQPLRTGLIDEGHILAELGTVLDRAPDIRRDPAEITVFKSVGSAVQDFVCAKYLFDKSESLGR